MMNLDLDALEKRSGRSLRQQLGQPAAQHQLDRGRRGGAHGTASEFAGWRKALCSSVCPQMGGA
jgi:hypothetical protein